MQNTDTENVPIEDWQTQRDKLLRIAKAQGIQDASASDVVNSTIRRVVAKDRSKQTVTYLVTSLFNKIRDRWRRKKRRPSVNMGNHDGTIVEPSEIDFVKRLADQSEAASLISKLLSVLNNSQREVFDLYYMQQKERAEVCSELGISQGTLASKIRTIQNKAKLVSGNEPGDGVTPANTPVSSLLSKYRIQTHS